jgi:hypothetical protein
MKDELFNNIFLYNVSIKMSINVDKKSISLKDAKYKHEQDKIYNEMLKEIKYNDDTRSFFVDDVDREYIIDEMYEEVKKYYRFDVWGRVDMKKDSCHISLIKKIFDANGYELILKKVMSIKNSKKTQRKKYIVVDK